MVLALLMALLSVIPMSAAAVHQPTIDDYMKISMEVMEKYDMVGKMEYGIKAVPDRTLEEHREFMEEIVSMSAYAYNRWNNPSDTPAPIRGDRSQAVLSATQTKRYSQSEYFYYNKYFKISCAYTIALDGYNAWISSSTQEIKNTILGRTSILGGLRGYLFQQTSVDVRYYNDGSFEAMSSGSWKMSTASGEFDYGTLLIVHDFAKEELAYARANGRFK